MEQELELILRDMLDDFKSLKTNYDEQHKNLIEVINTLNELKKHIKNFPVVDNLQL